MIDPFTSHWLSEGGGQHDQATKGWSEQHDTTPSNDTYENRVRRDNEDLEQSTRSAIDESKSRDTDRSDWDESKPHREWLGTKYPDVQLDTYVGDMLNWHDLFRRDPLGAKEAYVRHWATRPPVSPRPKSASAQPSPPDGMKERDRPDWQLFEDAKSGYAAAVADKNDRDSYSATSELRQAVHQQTGLTLSQFLDCCKQIDEASTTDAAAVATRFAQFSGAPSTPQHGAELQAQNLLSHVIESGTLPGLGRDDTLDATVAGVLRSMPRTGDQLADLQNAYGVATQRLDAANQATDWARATLPDYGQLEETIADILHSPQFRRSGDMRTDVSLAHAVARDWVASGYRSRGGDDADAQVVVSDDGQGNPAMQNALEKVGNAQAKLQSMAAEKARRASRSVSGSPSPGGSSGPRWDNSVEDDVRAAVRSAAGRI